MFTIFIVNNQKGEVVEFVKDSNGNVKHFMTDGEAQDRLTNLSYPFNYTAYVFSITDGEITDWT
jgi:hypothetical protein